ncbi:YebC/PmpR family DNA-binding transcriptional regulator [Dethiobacter alkaliphilus]|uniref:YebC/PmpR family DNA-binding transcriptional regulator n=1 Tax=Dethiobacter alkaliphilus TaxID=427926 RepID=UPI00222743A2|nr:YebC/PmpR family DNA-binding transcriptional regulator [Dethiobacter alkaliphilus]MCW3490417.1 YebC/PmpR family DNA-binding transcriptional regulator [Dethiobacter alkaliphilus]
MAGHSKWANIKHRKARVDAQKGKVFTKISKEIMAAVRQGGGDPNNNFRLRLALQKARSVNMPNDNIQRAIQKGAGELEGTNFEEIIYEGYGPAGTAVMLEILTDNRNRTAGEIRHIFSKSGGSLGETGCVAWMFNRRGYLEVSKEGHDEDELMLLALDAGAEDFEAGENAFEIYTRPDDFEAVKEKMEAEGISFGEAAITMIPETTVEVPDVEGAQKALALIEALEDHDDVQNAYSNLDVPSEVMAELENE